MNNKETNFNPIPQIICGIETDKIAMAQRRIIVEKEYKSLLEKLKRTTGKKTVHNDFLNVDVSLVMAEGGKEATNRSTFNWQSTYAVKKLEMVIKNAVALDGEPIYVPAKDTGNQKRYKYVNLAVLYYTFKSEKYQYLNFIVKLTLGVKKDGKHVHYSINKIDIV
ncbi:hypothetical protein FACS189440_10340 [Bacteroidia bacterium]|nr:hypothetical protein FACS189440_10340 [Bacteroidia bacterium]